MRYIYFKNNNLMVPCERVKVSFVQAYNEHSFMHNNFVESTSSYISPTSPKKSKKSQATFVKKFNPL